MLDRARPLPSCLTCCLLLSSLLLAWGPAAAAGAEMSEVVLRNGMRVVLRPVPTNPVICSAVLVRAGVAWEAEDSSGASHFLEHLLFNGTESRTQEQLYADVDRIGPGEPYDRWRKTEDYRRWLRETRSADAGSH